MRPYYFEIIDRRKKILQKIIFEKEQPMPKKARKKSSLCINHVILRGVNQQIIFEDEYDYQQFIDILRYYKDEEKCSFKLYAYCLMDNHVHLLIEHTTVSLDEIMKRIEIKFVKWYNKRYRRIGHLFQERYKSEPVEDIEYLKIVFRYIHQNPLHAGIEKVPGAYPWSSYHDYANQDNSFIDIERIFDLFQNYEECMTYLHTLSDKMCMELQSFGIYGISDEDAMEIIQKKTDCKSPADFQRLGLLKRNQYLKELKDSGISVRQLSRLTGISRGAINAAINQS